MPLQQSSELLWPEILPPRCKESAALPVRIYMSSGAKIMKSQNHRMSKTRSDHWHGHLAPTLCSSQAT